MDKIVDMKTIQMTIDEDLLQKVDEIIKQKKSLAPLLLENQLFIILSEKEFWRWKRSKKKGTRKNRYCRMNFRNGKMSKFGVTDGAGRDPMVHI